MEEDLAALARPGWIPLVILIVMFIAVFFLWRSMRRMLRTIDPDLPHKADLEADARGDDSEERAIERARRGDAPSGAAAGLVAQPPDSGPASTSRD